MDVFLEQIIKKKASGIDYLIYLGVIVAAIILLLASMIFIHTLSAMVRAGAMFGAYYLITMRDLEYEYSFTNGDLTVDKIIHRRSRKRLISFDVHTVEEMGKYDPQKHAARDYSKRLIVSQYADGRDSWYMTFRHSKFGNTLLVFTPDEKILAAVKGFLPRQVAVDAFRGN